MLNSRARDSFCTLRRTGTSRRRSHEPSTSGDPLLSEREAEVLRLCSRGLSNQEIADALSITVGTTKGHLHRIFLKLQVRNRTAAVAKARELRLL